RSAARRMVRSTRIGDIGWLGPKSYSVSVGSNTTVAGPRHAGMRRRLLVLPPVTPSDDPWRRRAPPSLRAAVPPAGGGPPASCLRPASVQTCPYDGHVLRTSNLCWWPA